MTTFSPAYRVAASVASWLVHRIIRVDWRGLDNLPDDGGYIVAANHVTEFDGLTLMQPLVDHGIPVRVLCKASLFKVPVLGWIMRQAGQVPVYRESGRGGAALSAATQALQEGEVIAIFPEGTLTRDPDYWPMTPKTGVGRLALSCDAPIIPVAQWGAHRVLGRYSRKLRLWGRPQVTVQFGEPIDISDVRAIEDQKEAARIVSDRVIDAITDMLSVIRQEGPLPVRYDMKKYGDPGKSALGRISDATYWD